MSDVTLDRITADHAELVAGFLDSMPEGDRTFFKERVDAGTVRRWASEDRPRWLLLGPSGAMAYLAVLPGVGWSAHVGELRMIVAPEHRRRGIGTMLVRQALLAALDMGLHKLTVDVVADKAGDVQMFAALGFEAEGLLKDHMRDRDGRLRDLLVMSMEVGGVHDDLAVVGIAHALGMRS